MGKGEWSLPVSRNNHTLTVLLYRYNTFMSVHLHLFNFYDHVNLLCDPAVSGLCHGSSSFFEEFFRNLVKTLSIMTSRRNRYSLHNYAYIVLITVCHVVLSNDSCIALNFLSSASTFGRKHCACAPVYLMCL